MPPWEKYQDKGVKPWERRGGDEDSAKSTNPIGEFLKSAGTGVAQTALEAARGEQIESEQRAMAFGKPDAGPKIPTGDEATKQLGLHEPQGFAGEAGKLAGEYAVNPLTYFGPGSAVAKFLTTAAAAFGGAAGKQLTGSSLGELGGAAVGGASPAAVLHLASPILMNTARQAASNVLHTEGVNAITAGQRTGSKALEYWEGYLGDAPFAGGQATQAREQAGRQFTRAALRRAGIQSDLATPQVIDSAFRNIGNQMDVIAARNNVQMDLRFVNELLAANHEYNMVVPEGSRRAVVQNTLDDFLGRLQQSPTLSGDQVQRFRSRLLRLQRSSFNDPEYSALLGDYVNAIDNMVQRSLTNLPDAQAWRVLRRQYRNLIPLTKASVGAGEQAAEGIITPARLRQALTSTERGRREYARGQGDFSTLVHAGNLVMTPLPNSGTAQREMARAFASALGAAGGYVLSGGGEHGIGGAAVGAAAAPGALGRVLMSQPAQAYLGGTLPGQATARAAQAAMPSAANTAVRSVAPLLPNSLGDAAQQQ
jgi:hypothetical protein